MWGKMLLIYDHIVDRIPGIERKGKTVPYTSVNGYMFSLLNKEGELGIRLPGALKDEFEKHAPAMALMSHGAVMRDYVKIPEPLLKDEELIAAFLKKSFDYFVAMPPNKGKKK